MTADLWTTLLPLAMATALMPIELAIVVLMMGSPGGRSAAFGWIAGMTVVRLAQFAIFGFVLDAAMDDGNPEPSPVEGTLLLVVAVLLLVMAVRKVLNQPDDDAPPPRWMTMIGTLSAPRAFAFGLAFTALSPKLWALTLGAVGAITDAQLDSGSGWLAFVVFALVASSLHLAALIGAVIAPSRAGAALARVGDLLERYNRPVMIGIGFVFGAWFLYKALVALNA